LKKLVILFLIISILLTACAQDSFKNNQVYLVERDGDHEVSDFQGLIDTQGKIPFLEADLGFAHSENLNEKILINVAPHGTKAFFMERLAKEQLDQVFLGQYNEQVNLYEYDLEKDSLRLIAEQIPFITKTSWNNDGSLIAFNGGNRLMIYDTKRGRFLMEHILRTDPVSYFFWSHNDNRIYSEHPDQVNGSIYYINLQKKVEAYEIRGNLYLKGQLDDNLFYGTRWIGLEEENNSETIKDNIYTVIVDSQNNIVKVIGKGIFRDAYKKSVILVGTNNFGLNYIPNIDKPEEVVKLSSEYIYDVKFVNQGNLAYITKNNNLDSNLFTLHLVNANGREVKSIDISGSRFSLFPNGKRGFVSGFKEEVVDFTTNEITSVNEDFTPNESLSKTIRGAVDLLYKNAVYGYNDWQIARKYFAEQENNEQWAFLKEKSTKANIPPYKVDISLLEEDIDQASATITINISIIESTGDEYQDKYTLKLVKKNNDWLVIEKSDG
jgi:hypothetical protein